MSSTLPEPTAQLPRHIAIIMDGNGRWARRRNQPRVVGHQAGARRVREIATACARMGIEQLSLYALSVENYARRPPDEIATLMDLLRQYTIDERPTLMDNDIRFRVVGRVDELPEPVVAEVRKTEQMTADNPGTTLCIAVNYGGRSEIADAARALATRAADEKIDPATIDEHVVDRHMYTTGMPDVDLLIRTAGEQRISNFLLWQAWYAELYITETLWPDFDEAELGRALEEYRRRERKFGAVAPDHEGQEA
ncbi:MAG: polyprenyl diphosphate synthase [bacterium]